MDLRSTVGRLASRLGARRAFRAIAASEAVSDAHCYLASDQDKSRLAAAAENGFERIYYGHQGRVIFKWSHYLAFYERLLAPLVGKDITVVEIGLARGGSIQLWREYLGPQIRFVGVDINESSLAYQAPGVEILIGDQGNKAFLQKVAALVGVADVIIDDGSHVCAHQILTLESLFPVLRVGGVYVCEDLHTSYWPGWGGGPGAQGTFIEYLKSIIDRMHARYYDLRLAEDDIANQIGAIELRDSIVATTKTEQRKNYIVEVGGVEVY